MMHIVINTTQTTVNLVIFAADLFLTILRVNLIRKNIFPKNKSTSD